MTSVLGVDGWRGAWVAVRVSWSGDEDGPARILGWDAGRFSDLVHDDDTVIAVDMPIGLPDGAEPRACDLEAQQALGRQRGSIFLAPPRATLSARDPREFQRIHRSLRGVGAGLPVWGIVPKMREVNRALEADPELQKRVESDAHSEQP